ncbi:MAG: LysM peptidoglycan-binding domain-containing protein [Alkalispirochaeta sp.]
MIGIRLADHSVFPVFSSDEPGSKRIVLTTARDDQERVDIELVRADDVHADRPQPLLIGRITLDDLQAGHGGEPEVDLVLRVTPEGRLDATATNRATGNAQSLSIDIDRAATEAEFSVPESLTESFEPEFAAEVHEEPRSRRSGWLLVVAIIAIVSVLAGGMWWLLLRTADEDVGADAADDVPITQSPEEEIELPQEPEPADSSDPRPQEEEPVVTDSPPPPEADGTSVEYRIRRGDTLWDLSETFYGTPWLFSELADANEISNPNLIYAESELEIPEELLRREN